MAIKQKHNPHTERVQIQDYAHELIPALPEDALKRVPGLEAWSAKVRDNFDILLKNLYRKSQDVAETFATVTNTVVVGPAGPAGATGADGKDGEPGPKGDKGSDGSGGGGSIPPAVTNVINAFKVATFYIWNETTSTWTQYACKNNGDGLSELYVVAEGLTLPAGFGFIYFDINNESTSSYTRFRCTNNLDGNSELYASDEGLP
jgi:hypothetical protein